MSKNLHEQETRENTLSPFMALAKRIHINARAKGFYDKIDELLTHPALTLEQKDFISHLWRGSRMMLVVSEIGEAMEALRRGNESEVPGSGGVAEEYADAVIRILDELFAMSCYADNVIMAKIKYNENRPYMHGGKKS